MKDKLSILNIGIKMTYFCLPIEVMSLILISMLVVVEIHCRGTPNLTKSEICDLSPFLLFFFLPAPTEMMTGDAPSADTDMLGFWLTSWNWTTQKHIPTYADLI